MLIALKTLHFLSLWAAGGIGLGGWVIQSVHARRGARPGAEVVQALRLMGLIALLSVLLLWATGIALALSIHGTLAVSAAFWVKLAGAAVLLLASLATNLETLRAMRAGAPPRAGLMTGLAWTIRAALVGVLVATAVAFG